MLKSAKAFTLVEAIVVIMVVFVLVSFLLPEFGTPRNTARRVLCGSNMRSIGTGMVVYANDSHGKLPAQSYWSEGGWTTTVMYRRDCLKDHAETDEGTVKLLKPFGPGGLYDIGIIDEFSLFYCPGLFIVMDKDEEKKCFEADYYTQQETGDFIIPENDEYLRSSYSYFKNNVQAIDKMANRTYLYDLIYSRGMIAHCTVSGKPKGMNVLYGDGHVEFRTDAELLKKENWGATEGEYPAVNAASFFRILKLAGNNSPELKEGENASDWICNEDPFDGARKGTWRYKGN